MSESAIHVRISDELMDLVDQARIAGKHRGRADLARAALRHYLDLEQYSDSGQISKPMKARLDRLDRQLVQMQVNQSTLMILTAQMIGELFQTVTGKEGLNAALAVKEAFDTAQQQHDNIQGRSQDIVAQMIHKRARKPPRKQSHRPKPGRAPGTGRVATVKMVLDRQHRCFLPPYVLYWRNVPLVWRAFGAVRQSQRSPGQ
jgi:hypothetical protein